MVFYSMPTGYNNSYSSAQVIFSYASVSSTLVYGWTDLLQAFPFNLIFSQRNTSVEETEPHPGDLAAEVYQLIAFPIVPSR